MFLGNFKDSVWEDWGTVPGRLGESLRFFFIITLKGKNIMMEHPPVSLWMFNIYPMTDPWDEDVYFTYMKS